MGFMKTEQEQIKAIKQIIDERVETNLGQVQGRHGNVIKTVDTIIIARDIVDAGYGDVSEYKAEIERLNAENTTLYEVRNNLLEENNKLLKDNVALILDKRQAQIDVLNRLKERYGFYSCCSWMCVVKSLTEIIDEFIKEIRAQ